MAGGKKAHNGFLYLALGAFLGLVADFVYQSQGLPGYSRKLAICPSLTEGDAYQIGGLTAINAGGVLVNNFALTAVTSGMLLGNFAPKVAVLLGFPRYFIYDVDSSSGTVKAVGGGARTLTGEHPTTPATHK